MKQGHAGARGFALPTVLIASIVMLTVLAVSVSSVAAVRTSLKVQYYEQLAKAAGEAGVAYAKACLAKNANVPLWTNAKPLTPSTDCAGNVTASPAVYVLTNDTVRSAFSVGVPALNAEGKAISIPNNGYVELLRASNGAVWRTYRQPAVQSAVVPDLCSGAATSSLGWSNAVLASGANQFSLPDASTASAITLSDGTLPAGQLYFRRDFTLTESGVYKISALTNSAKDKVEVYVDGTARGTSQGSLATTNIALDAGCHTITARLTNKTFLPAYSEFVAAVSRPGSSAPIVATDSSWRVSSGVPVSFSNSDYYADPDIWAPVVSYMTPYAQQSNTAWKGYGDGFSALISPSGNGCPTACPGDSTAYLRDTKDFYLASDTYVTVALLCDNACAVYIDGQIAMQSGNWNNISAQSMTIPAGYHRVGIQLYNATTSANGAGAAMSIVPNGGGAVIARTDTSWVATTSWRPGIAGEITAYEASYSPSPKEIIDPVTADILVVGGGGGGGRNAAGGGGAGGVRYIENVPLAVQSYNVTIGAGGVGGTSNTTPGTQGGPSAFGAYLATGGGGGASRDGGAAASSGGSGGGGSGASAAARTPGAAGTSGQGNNGGAGTTADSGVNSGGGGGGGAGNVGVNAIAGGDAGAGGPGRIYYITGARLAVGGGGGGGLTVNGVAGIATDGGGAGSLTGPAAGSANTGGGGGGGGSGGGAGGSGTVIVRVKKGSVTLGAGAPTPTEVTVRGVTYQIYRYNSSGTFNVTGLIPS